MADGKTTDSISRREFIRRTARGAAGAIAASALSPLALAQDKKLPDDALLDLVQKQTLNYFWDFAHPASGMALECSNEESIFGKDIVATGGTGFGIMGMIAGASRGWHTKEETLRRITRIVGFLETADRYHGIFPHWLNGKTGKTFSFPGSKDDGADLVETSFLMMGLLTARQYFSGDSREETTLREKINKLWQEADWQFHTQEGKKTHLYWHWSPNHGWAMNLPIQGWNEALITQVLAASSPTHAVSPEVYHQSWARGNDFKNGHTYNGIELPLGPKGGGPLFMSQYSFIGLSPVGLKDKYADYWLQNKNHTLVNRAYCIKNPKGFKGYGPQCWGLTSSENDKGYGNHCPTHDVGVIAPTAALSAFPYTPEYSMQVLRHLWEDHPHEKIWNDNGFTDAFKADKSWYSKHSYAIDQGPVIGMIENYRSGLLWSLFMSCPEVKAGLKKLGFESPYLAKGNRAGGTKLPGARTIPELMAKLCGPDGLNPLTDAQLAGVLGLSDGQWQARQFREGLKLMDASQQRALLAHAGITDEVEIARAAAILSVKSSVPAPSLP